MINIAVLASGSGSNAENLIKYFHDHPKIRIILVATNNPEAGVIDRAKSLNTPYLTFNREEFANGTLKEELVQRSVDLLILAGFLWLIPENLIAAFPNRILNIHPALLPGYGGKGMYGDRVHRAVIDAGEEQSGITIHLVNARYDEGNIVFQKAISIDPEDTPESLAIKIHELEYEHYPKVVEEYALNLK